VVFIVIASQTEKQNITEVNKMANTQDYFETDAERENGHVDTRSRNFECENPDPSLGCDLGIDVQG
jgi:hypothetical protein